MKADELKAPPPNHVKDDNYWKKLIEDHEVSNLTRLLIVEKIKLIMIILATWWRKLKNKSVKTLIPVKIKSELVPQPEINRALSTLTFKNGNSIIIYDKEALLLILSKMI